MLHRFPVSESACGDITEGSSVNLSRSDANSAVKYTWYKKNVISTLHFNEPQPVLRYILLCCEEWSQEEASKYIFIKEESKGNSLINLNDKPVDSVN